MFCLLGDHRHRLDAGRARADQRDALPGEIDRLMRPMAGVVDLALETVEAFDVGDARIRQTAGREHDEFCRYRLAVRGRDLPNIAALVEFGALNTGVELDVAPQVKTIGDVVRIFQDLRLRGLALAPVPLLLQFIGEGIGILHALDVATRAGIAIPVPGAPTPLPCSNSRAVMPSPRNRCSIYMPAKPA